MELLQDPRFWVAVAFVIFVVLVARPAGRMIGGNLDSRSSRIKAELDEARKLREEAQSLLADYQRKQRDALKEAEDVLAHAVAEAERMQREASANLDAALARRERMAMDKIAQAEAQAIADVRNRAVDVAIGATTRLLSDTIDAHQAGALVDSAITDLSKQLH
ncbi:F0F1 ATP synthase subunit B [Rhodospirillaceae bacterium SYSU D60014]|uniref:F0F1 ATP synthase subunit B family protein n=1 Tax=Virgifigura deserti TaxID=2268457 RepID=UPI000E66E0B7